MLQEIEDPGEDLNLYKWLFTIDYEGAKSTRFFFTDMSFSYISWRSIELLEQGLIDIYDLDDETIR